MAVVGVNVNAVEVAAEMRPDVRTQSDDGRTRWRTTSTNSAVPRLPVSVKERPGVGTEVIFESPYTLTPR